MSGSYFTVPFEMGRVVVHTSANGSVTAIDFDLDDNYDEIRSGSRLSGDIKRYFKGERVHWDLDLDMNCETDFRRRVYERVFDIPYGQTATYGDIASDIGSRGGARAVGQAMACNRFPLVVPCHRVVACNRGLGGFSSGLELKRYLLCLEGNSI